MGICVSHKSLENHNYSKNKHSNCVMNQQSIMFPHYITNK
jgi:hypothetical protein